jgi:hypothetical protein
MHTVTPILIPIGAPEGEERFFLNDYGYGRFEKAFSLEDPVERRKVIDDLVKDYYDIGRSDFRMELRKLLLID